MGHRQDSVLAGLYGCIVQPSVLLSVGRTDVHPRTGQMVVLYIHTDLPIHLAGQMVVLYIHTDLPIHLAGQMVVLYIHTDLPIHLAGQMVVLHIHRVLLRVYNLTICPKFWQDCI